jgi:hypothetical protein
MIVIAMTTPVLTSLSACGTWRTTSTPLGELIPAEQPDVVRITTVDGITVIVRSPSIAADSLVSEMVDERMSVPLGQVAQVEVRTVNAIGTTALIVGVALIATTPIRHTVGCFVGLSSCGN